jgi:hypothetical protein
MTGELPEDWIPLDRELPTIIRTLRKPAGDDPRFASFGQINENFQAFAEAVHSTWKQLHNRSLDDILTIEKILASVRRDKVPEAFVWYLERTIALWRRINDAIVWSLVREQDHVIRTVCHRKDRLRLTDANPTAIRNLLDQINADPQSIAIWSDATSCVDVGDVVCRSFSGGLNGFFEAKSGTMNDKIFELLEVKGGVEDKISAISDFADKYGPKAVKQLERFVKQRQKYNQVMDIIDHDRGYHPRHEAEVIIQETETQLKSYDEELQLIIDASTQGPVTKCIDRCLWIFVNRDNSKSPEDKILDFERELSAASPSTLQWYKAHFGSDEPFRIALLEDNLTCPEAIPLFLRHLEPETIREVLIGDLMYSVFLFVDWCELGRIITEFGAELTWSSRKRGRAQQSKPRLKRSLTFGERIPRVQLGKRYWEGFSKIYRVLYEGITPSSIAAQYVEALKSDTDTTSTSEKGG